MFMLSKLKKLAKEQVDLATDWLQIQIEENGGNETIAELGVIVIKYIRSA